MTPANFLYELGFDFSNGTGGSRFSFINVEPIDGTRFLFTFDAVDFEARTLPGSLTGSPVGSDYRQSDYQRGAEVWTVDCRIATPLEALTDDTQSIGTFWDGITGVPAPLVRVPTDGESWVERSSRSAQALDLVRGAPLWVSFSRHGIFKDVVLTAVNDRRDQKLSARMSLTFETLRRATTSTIQVPRLPRLQQQTSAGEAARQSLLEQGFSEEDQNTILYSMLDDLFGFEEAPPPSASRTIRDFVTSQGDFSPEEVTRRAIEAEQRYYQARPNLVNPRDMVL